MKSWEKRRDESIQLVGKYNFDQNLTNLHNAVLKVLPLRIHEDILRALFFYYQRWVWTKNSQPKMFEVTHQMRRNAVSKMFEDILYISIYYSYMLKPMHQLFVKQYFNYVYGKLEEEIQNLFPNFSISDTLNDFSFYNYDKNIIVYPEDIADVEKIKGLIRITQLRTDTKLTSLFHEPVKYLDRGFAFKIGFPKFNQQYLDKILDLLEPFKFELIQSSLSINPTSSDTIFNNLQTNRLELFLSNINWTRNDIQYYDKYNQTKQLFNNIHLGIRDKKRENYL